MVIFHKFGHCHQMFKETPNIAFEGPKKINTSVLSLNMFYFLFHEFLLDFSQWKGIIQR